MKKYISLIICILMLVTAVTVMPLTTDAADTDAVGTGGTFAADDTSTGEEEEKENEEYRYDIQYDSVFILAYLGHESEVVIPDTIDGLPVVGIVAGAFDQCDFVTNITVPETLNYVGMGALDDTAFYKNKANWDNNIFYLGNVLYAVDTENLEGECVIKEGTLDITERAFVDCDKLTKLTIPGTVNTVSLRTFVSCDELTDLTISEGTKIIEPGAFAYCKKLENITLPQSLEIVYQGVFSGTGYYNNIYNWENGGLYLGHVLLTVDPETSGEFTVREGTTLLANEAFIESRITRVNLPHGLKRLADYTFNCCNRLKEIRFNDDIEELGCVWTSDSEYMTTFEVPASVKKLDTRSFGFSKFSEIKLNENLKEIGKEAFASCDYLKEITVPKNVEIIGENAFGYDVLITQEGYHLEKVDDFVIKGYPGTLAEAYAKQHGFKFVDVTIKDISGLQVEGIKDTTYTGKNITLNIAVKDGSKLLSEGTDYTTLYENNLNAGEATVTITGKGKYTGQIRKIFKIAKAANPMTVKTSTKKLKLNAIKKKAQKIKAITVDKAQGNVSYKIISTPKKLKKKVKINSKGVITISKWPKAKKGTYKIKVEVKAEGGQDYNSGTLARTVKVKVK